MVVDRIGSSLAHARQARIVKEQIERARLLGQDAKEIEWFMRAVYELPLHDITYEQDIIRSRMSQIEQQIPSLGREGGQLASYALGRGYLALHETSAAYEHLRAACDSGPHSPQLHYALGRVLWDRFFEGRFGVALHRAAPVLLVAFIGLALLGYLISPSLLTFSKGRVGFYGAFSSAADVAAM